MESLSQSQIKLATDTADSITSDSLFGKDSRTTLCQIACASNGSISMNQTHPVLNIVIVGYVFGFPNGHGASARISQYARGLSEKGMKVTILCLKPTEPPDGPILNHTVNDEYQGASFEYTAGTTIFSKSRVIRYIQNIKGIIGAFRSVRSLSKDKPVHAILFYGTDSPFYTACLWIMAKMYGACFLGENTEAPYVYCRPSLRNSCKKVITFGLTHKLFDGFIVISTYLERTFRNSLKPRAPILRLPVLVNTDIFSLNYDFHDSSNKIIVYCGNLEVNGEIAAVLDIWSRIKHEFPDWKVRIIGDNSSPDVSIPLIRRVKELDIDASTEFTGLVPRNGLPDLLQSGDVMILPRSEGLFSQAGLPNKLGEYLATGKPVVITKTSDIEIYLRDRIDAFLVQPNDFHAFADTLRYVMNNPDEAKQVGLNGQAAAKKYFDTKYNCGRLIDFIQEVCRQKIR